MKTTKELLGARIRELRKDRLLSQEGLAEQIGIDPKHLSRIESGRGFPSLPTLENIANVLQVEIKALFDYHHLDTAEQIDHAIELTLKAIRTEDKKLILRLLKAVTE